jgi:hypothetical protein
MSVSIALVIGGVIGALDGVGIFFARDFRRDFERNSRSSLGRLVAEEFKHMVARRLIRVAVWVCLRSGDFPCERRIQIEGRSVRSALRGNPGNSHGTVAC